MKVICCTHTMKDFHATNKEFIKDTNIDFNCDCVTYGSHRLYFCLYCECLRDFQKARNIHSLNDKWLKFCSHEANLNSLSFNGQTRFFKYQEFEIPIHWYDRISLFRKKL